MQPNIGTFIQGGGGSTNRGATQVRLRPGGSLNQLRELLSSQNGDKLSREVSETEEERMLISQYNYRTRR